MIDGGNCTNPYCDKCVYKRTEERNCIMLEGYKKMNVSDEEMYCSDCITAIFNHLDSHH